MEAIKRFLNAGYVMVSLEDRVLRRHLGKTLLPAIQPKVVDCTA
jgi:hypothetical protein